MLPVPSVFGRLVACSLISHVIWCPDTLFIYGDMRALLRLSVSQEAATALDAFRRSGTPGYFPGHNLARYMDTVVL